MSEPPSIPHPEPVHASPTEAKYLDDPEMAFWRPTVRETMKYLGWRWLWFAPIPLLLLLTLTLMYFHQFYIFFNGGMIKLWILAYGAAAAAALAAIKVGVKARRDPFCIRCGYSLTGLPDGHRCPECGLPGEHRMIAEYRRDPEGFISRWKARNRLPAASTPLDVEPRPAAARRPRKRSRDGT